MTSELKIGEIIETSTSGYIAQCYELNQLPPLGCLVRTRGNDFHEEIYGVVYNAMTSGIEPGRRPIARGKDASTEEEIYQANPQLLKLLRSEFSILVIGFLTDSRVYQYLPPYPARIHNFVHLCSSEEIRKFTQSFDFLNLLLKSRLEIPTEALVGAVLRQMSLAQEDRQSFLVSAGKELAALLSEDYGQLKAILKGLKYESTR
jgi:hypothetical protein